MPHRISVSGPLAAAALLGLASLAGCASYLQSSDNILGVITPYRIEIVQGNVVTKEQLALVKPGMQRAQVRDVLGSPLLTDIFHTDRWDYMFTIRRQGTAPQQRRVTAYFDGERLARIEADELPTEQEFVDSIDTFKRRGDPPTLQLTEAQLKALPAPPARSAEEAPPEAPARTYPPLEPAGR